MVRKALFRTVVFGVKINAVGERDWPISEYSEIKWGIIAKQQVGGGGWEITKRRH